MSRAAKTPKYEAFNKYSNCFDLDRRPKDWNQVFGNDNQTVLELGAGKAEFSLGLAQLHKDRNYIAIDRKADRLYRPATTAIDQNIDNIKFLKANLRILSEFFMDGSIEEIWITFPDPYPKDRQEKHRMLGPPFLEQYQQILKQGGVINLKTDNTGLFNWVVEQLESNKKVEIEQIERNLHNSKLPIEYKIKTTYENKFMALGEDIKYLRFHFS